MSSIAVQLDNVCFAYEKEWVLKHISADIKEKKICFVMGNNGSGKTTLLKNIMGFLSPQNGCIRIAGKDVSAMKYTSMSKVVSYVPQAIHLNSDFKVIDYLSLGRTPHSGFINHLGDSDYEIIDKYSTRFGVAEYFETEFNKLSGGQKQMVAIVRSLIQDTQIIVLDEPMSALDIGKQVDLLKAFNELTNEGKTIILTTHNPNHALSINSEVCFMKHGEIVSYGKSKEIISESILHEIYGGNVALDHGKYDSVVFNTRAI